MLPRHLEETHIAHTLTTRGKVTIGSGIAEGTEGGGDGTGLTSKVALTTDRIIAQCSPRSHILEVSIATDTQLTSRTAVDNLVYAQRTTCTGHSRHTTGTARLAPHAQLHAVIEIAVHTAADQRRTVEEAVVGRVAAKAGRRREAGLTGIVAGQAIQRHPIVVELRQAQTRGQRRGPRGGGATHALSGVDTSQTGVVALLTHHAPVVVIGRHAVAQKSLTVQLPLKSGQVASLTSQGVGAGLTGIVTRLANSTPIMVIPINTSAIGSRVSIVGAGAKGTADGVDRASHALDGTGQTGGLIGGIIIAVSTGTAAARQYPLGRVETGSAEGRGGLTAEAGVIAGSTHRGGDVVEEVS